MPVSIAKCQGALPDAAAQAVIIALDPSNGVRCASRARPMSALEHRREHQHRPGDARCTQLGALIHRRDTVAPRREPLQRARDRHGAKAVAVRFDHWQDRDTGAAAIAAPLRTSAPRSTSIQARNVSPISVARSAQAG